MKCEICHKREGIIDNFIYDDVHVYSCEDCSENRQGDIWLKLAKMAEKYEKELEKKSRK